MATPETLSSAPAGLQELLDKEAIREVIYRFCRGNDRRDREMMQSCFHPDAIDDHGVYSGPALGFYDAMAELDARVRAIHHLVGQSIIEVAGDHAAGETYATATIDGLLDDDEVLMLTVRYIDRFERRDGEWKIADRFVAFDTATTAPGRVPDQPERNLGRRDRDDRSHAVFAELRG